MPMKQTSYFFQIDTQWISPQFALSATVINANGLQQAQIKQKHCGQANLISSISYWYYLNKPYSDLHLLAVQSVPPPTSLFLFSPPPLLVVTQNPIQINLN